MNESGLPKDCIKEAACLIGCEKASLARTKRVVDECAIHFGAKEARSLSELTSSCEVDCDKKRELFLRCASSVK